LRPQNDLPIVPIYTNIFAPPLPRPKRFVELGRTVRQLVESWPSGKRVAVIGTGHLSLELGGPRQFGPTGPDPEFDRKAVEWISSGDIEGCLAEVTHDYPRLFELGAHPFLTLTLFIGMFERDHEPLGFQLEYARRLSHMSLPYPDIAT
jgi:protocatechuate 4,5-dioxygenase, beta chain